MWGNTGDHHALIPSLRLPGEIGVVPNNMARWGGVIILRRCVIVVQWASSLLLNPTLLLLVPVQVAARRGFVDDIIDPALTRRILCQDLQLLRDKPPQSFRKKHSNIPL